MKKEEEHICEADEVDLLLAMLSKFAAFIYREKIAQCHRDWEREMVEVEKLLKKPNPKGE